MSGLPPLYAIVNISDHQAPLAYITELLSAGVCLLQLRPKPAWNPAAVEIAQAAIALRTSAFPQARFIINDAPEICHQLGADGVHLGQGDGSVENARQLLGSDAIIGLSTHTLPQVERAPHSLLSYLAFGPVFLSSTKQGHASVVGLATLREVVRVSPLPVVAIGGITSLRAESIYETGVCSLAVISDLESAADVGSCFRAYDQAFLRTRSS